MGWEHRVDDSGDGYTGWAAARRDVAGARHLISDQFSRCFAPYMVTGSILRGNAGGVRHWGRTSSELMRQRWIY